MGRTTGKIHASYSSASVILDATTSAGTGGGLVGSSGGSSTVVASYATGRVTIRNNPTINGGIGGLVGDFGGTGSIVASYATGPVIGNNLPSDSTGGLVGARGAPATVTDSYYDSSTSGRSDTNKGTPKTSSELGAPAGYSGIYANWDVDLDGDGNGDDPWDFGTALQYPAIDYLELTPDTQARNLPSVTADAGEDQTVPEGATVSLRGSGSSTLRNPVFTYAWTQTSGTTVELSDPAAPRPTFTAPSPGDDLHFALVVHDGDSSTLDRVKVSVAQPSYRGENGWNSHLHIASMGHHRGELGCAAPLVTLLGAYPVEHGVAVWWEDPGISAITHYRYQIQEGNGVGFDHTHWEPIPGSDGDTTYFVLDNDRLTSGQQYSILLQAVAGGRLYCFDNFVWFTPTNPDAAPSHRAHGRSGARPQPAGGADLGRPRRRPELRHPVQVTPLRG